MRKVLLNPSRGFNEIDGIVVVLFDTCSDCQDIRIKNNVFWWEIHPIDEDAIGSLAYSRLVLVGCGLSLLVKCHHYDCCSEAADNFGLFYESLFSLL